jgi:hypothetical protein
MRAFRTLPLALTGAALLATAACGGQPDGTGEAESGEMEAAPASAEMTSQELSCFMRAESMQEAQDRPSPLQTTTLTVGGQEALLCYGAPSARGREVMGGLVPFGESWRFGANEATAIHLPFAAEIGDVSVEPGSYSLWAIPGEDEWEIHVNAETERWGIPINDEVQGADVGSFTVEAMQTEEMVETLTFSWESHGEEMGHIVMEWENTRVEIPVHAAGM